MASDSSSPVGPRGEALFAQGDFETLGREAWTQKAEGVHASAAGFADDARLPLALPSRTPGWKLAVDVEDARLQRARKVIFDALEEGVDAIHVSAGFGHGVRLLTPLDIRSLISDIDLEKTAIYLNAGPETMSLGAALLSLLREKGALAAFEGSLGIDPFSELMQRGHLSGGSHAWLDFMRQTVAFSEAELTPSFKPICVDTQIYAEAGASPSDQIAFAVATMLDYARLVSARATADAGGVTPLSVFKRSMVRVGIGTSFFGELSKLRALRYLLGVVACDLFDEPGVMPPLYAAPLRRQQTLFDPWNNVLRETNTTAICAVGGADVVGTLPFDRKHGPSNSFAHRLSRNVSRISMFEGQLHHVDDPAAGSFLVEDTSRALADEAWARLQDIEKRGGMLTAIRNGYVKRWVKKSAEQGVLRDVVGLTLSPLAKEVTIDRKPVTRAEIEPDIGKMPAEVDADKQREYLVKLLRDKKNRLKFALDAVKERIDLVTLNAALVHAYPSLHIEPLAHFAPNAYIEKVRPKFRELSKTLRVAVVDATDGGAAKKLLGARVDNFFAGLELEVSDRLRLDSENVAALVREADVVGIYGSQTLDETLIDAFDGIGCVVSADCEHEALTQKRGFISLGGIEQIFGLSAFDKATRALAKALGVRR